MKYKVGDKVRFVKDWALTDGRVMQAKSVWVVNDTSKEHYLLYCVKNNLFVMVKHKFVDDYGYCEQINTAPSITKRINDKHNILNGLFNSDGSVDGEKLMEKLSNQSNDSNDMAKGSHYEKAAMQPLEVAQRMFTKEQFKAILAFQVMKYRLRKEYKGQKESDEYKALQYCYWLELANKGITIDPSKDKVPTGYEYKGVIL